MAQGQYSQAAIEKLASSGLTVADAKKLHIDYLSRERTAKENKSYKPLESLRFAYLEPSGKKMGNGVAYTRIRYLEQEAGFAQQTKGKKLSYMQAAGSETYAYYPPNQDWSILNDPTIPLIITEGELKAAKACKEGFPTIAVGGVWAWRSVNQGHTWLPSLDFPVWYGRHVYICFDADYHGNANVSRALIALAEELVDRGAHPHLAITPEVAEIEKTGIDDFLTYGGKDANEQFALMLHASPMIGLCKHLIAMNKKYIYVQDPGVIVNLKSLHKITPSAFKEHTESKEKILELTLTPEGETQAKRASAAAAWIRWPMRNECGRLTYRPGAEKIVEKENELELNIWKGWGCDSRRGSTKPFEQLIEHLFTGANRATKEWFLDWCAYPIQNPGSKMSSAAVIHGVQQGTGKSMVGYSLGRIYGDNFSEIDHADLQSPFNEWAEGKQFVMGDDVAGSNKRADADRLKKMITQQEIRINGKYVPSYAIPDCVNYFFTANHSDSFYLEDSDRRFFIHEVTVPPLDEQFYTNYMNWLENGGAEALFYYFQHRDISKFNPKAPALRTAAKDSMISSVQSDHGAWVRELRDDPDSMLMIGSARIQRDLFTAQELYALYNPDDRPMRVTAGTIGRELSNAGFAKANGGSKLFCNIDGRRRTLVFYIVRNKEKWLSASTKEMTAHINAAEKKFKAATARG